MLRFIFLSLTATALLAGCEDPGPQGTGEPLTNSPSVSQQSGPGEWDAPPNYEFDVRSSCGEQNFIGSFHIVVKGGKVVRAKGFDQSGRAAIRYMRDEIPTLVDLHGYALEADASDAEVVEVVYDENDGHPKRIDIDYSVNAIDDESCFVVTDYNAH
jgi:hypothetical protein